MNIFLPVSLFVVVICWLSSLVTAIALIGPCHSSRSSLRIIASRNGGTELVALS